MDNRFASSVKPDIAPVRVRLEVSEKLYSITPSIVLSCTALFSLVTLPTAYRDVRGITIAFAGMLLIVAAIGKDSLRTHVTIWTWTFFMITTGLFFLALGAWLNAPGPANLLTVYVIWPLLYAFAIGAFVSWSSQVVALRTLLFSELVICSYVCLYVLHEIGMVPDWLYPKLDLGQSMSLSGGFFKISMYPINSLIFLVPFSIAALMTWPSRGLISRRWLVLITIAGSLTALLSGRRALQLSVVISPIVTFILARAGGRSVRASSSSSMRLMIALVFVLLSGLAMVVSVLDIDLLSRWRNWGEGDAAGGTFAADERANQFWILLREWAGRPLLGWGLGATVAGYQRSYEMPWAYELSYVALLNQTGIVGFVLYSCGVIWIIYSCVKLIRLGGLRAILVLPVLVGFLCFLFGNATNPYLAAFDYLWALFLPLAFVNAKLLSVPYAPVKSQEQGLASVVRYVDPE